ncbi:MAG: hypothetical protein ACRCVT_15020 [Leadbetterella sp.]
MKNVPLLILLILLFTKCKNNTTEAEFNSKRVKDVNEIIKTIIWEDSLNILKDNPKSSMFCEELVKLEVYIPEAIKNSLPPPPPMFDRVSIKDLLNKRIENEVFFSAEDSLILLNQNQYKLNIGNELAAKINLTTREQEFDKRKLNDSYNYYEMTIPIFSKDNKKAFIQLINKCGKRCGSGKGIFLRKVNEKWKIVDYCCKWLS